MKFPKLRLKTKPGASIASHEPHMSPMLAVGMSEAEMAAAAESSALAQGRMNFLQNLPMASMGLPDSGQGITQGVGSVLDMVGMMGPEGMAVAALGHAAIGAYNIFHERQENERAPQIEDQNQRALDNRRLQRLEGVDGSAGAARQAAEASKDKLVEIENERRELEAHAKFDIFDLGSIHDHLTGAGKRKLRENSDAKAREEANLAREEAARKKHFAEEGAPLIEAQKKMNEGDTRGAEAMRDRVMWMREFKQLTQDGASESQAAEGAIEKVKAFEKEQQDQHAQAYAHLVNARDGAADTARVAAAAHEDRVRHTPSISIEELRQDMYRNHLEATQTVSRKNFSRP